MASQCRVGLLLLELQALLHVGLVLRGHHPLEGGLGIVDLPSQLGRTRNSIPLALGWHPSKVPTTLTFVGWLVCKLVTGRTCHIFPTQAGEVVESLPGWLARSELVWVWDNSQVTATQVTGVSVQCRALLAAVHIGAGRS